MSAGRFEAMTLTGEFQELLEDWRQYEEKTILGDIRRDILTSEDTAQVRRVAYAAGALNTLESFDNYLKIRIKREKSGLGRPKPRGLKLPFEE